MEESRSSAKITTNGENGATAGARGALRVRRAVRSRAVHALVPRRLRGCRRDRAEPGMLRSAWSGNRGRDEMAGRDGGDQGGWGRPRSRD
jgi:hypothetical protein